VLLLIGEGPDIENARKLAKSMGKQESIHFIGRVKNPYTYLQLADGLIVTSAYESFCLAALEAIASGVPVFGTHVGGIPEVIEHGKSGYLASPTRISDLSKYAVQHFSNATTVRDMQQQARLRSEKFFAEKIVPQYEAVYAALMSSLSKKAVASY
jgi:glycosyltransferase involved in cell wall biosynthesis